MTGSGAAESGAGRSASDLAPQPEDTPQPAEADQDYRRIFEASLDAIIISDLTGRIVEANPAACCLYGYSRDELVGLPSHALLHPESYRRLAAAMDTIRAGQPFWTPTIGVRKDGTLLQTEGQATLVAYQGAPHLLGVIHDVSARVHAEEQAREREEEYRRIFEATGDGLLIADFAGRIVAANRAACQIYGYAHEELVGLNLTALVAPEYAPRVRADIRTVQEGGSLRAQVLNRRKDGTLFPMEVHATGFTHRGRPHLLSVVRDVTQRAQAEEQLRQREAEYRAIVEATSDGLIIADLDGHLVEVNPALCRMHGYTRAEMLRLFPTEFIHPDDHAIFQEYMQTLNAGGSYQTVARDIRKDGTVFPVEVNGTTFLYRGQRHVLGVVRDITERVQAAQAVVEERQRLSRELHDSVSQALYGIGLGAETAYRLLEGDPDPVQARQSLDYVRTLAGVAMAEMRALIFDLRPESLETEGLVVGLGKQAQALAARQGIVVDTALCAEPAVSLAVKEALYRIAQEALHNAAKHAQARRLEVCLECGSSAVVLEVRDDGCGFDPAGSFPGHVGLRSMQERMARVGGTLQVTSAPGAGTCVRATAPVASAE